MSHKTFGANRILKKNRLVAAGLTDSELTRPLVLILCEQGCNQAIEHIKHGILTGGCAALAIDIPSLCDTAAEETGKNSLMFVRESIADLVEALLSMHSADGVAIVASSQAAASGMVMGAIRSNVPLAFLPAFFTSVYYPSLALNAKARISCGKASITELEDLAYGVSCGRSMEMDNLNSLCVFLEGCGIAVVDSVGAFSTDEKICAARRCGETAARRTTELTCPRKDLTAAGLDCGIAAYVMAGGTAAGLLDVLAIANENLLAIDLKYIENISEKLPRLAAVSPFGRFNIAAFSRAGGTLALLKEGLKIPKLISPNVKINGHLLVELLDKVEIKCGITNPRGSNGICCCGDNVFGLNCGDKADNFAALSGNSKNASAVNSAAYVDDLFNKNIIGLDCDEVISKIENPVAPEGGFGLLKGNLFDYGVFNRCVKDKAFKGAAVVFDSEEQLRTAVISGMVSSGTAIILRGQGAGDNGMPLLDLQSAINAAALSDVVIITDGRIIENPGCTAISLCFGETLATVKNGEPIEIDFKKGKINFNIAGKEINNRLKKMKNINESLSGGLLRYANLVGEPNNGCILRQKF